MQSDFLFYLQRIGNPFLDKFFINVTNLGSETFYILVITYIYWCVNKKLGIRMFLITMISAYTNVILKELFHTQRPIFYEGINSIYKESAPGYSFPSGHTQSSTTFWFYLMYKIRNKSMYLLGIIVIVLVGFSRLYLRVHWPIDVLGGIIFGIIIALISHYIIEKVAKVKFNYTLTIILAIIIPSFTLLFFLSHESITMMALLTGGLSGYVTEEKLIKLNPNSTRIQKIIKYVLGLGILLIIKSGLKELFPNSLLFDYIRYLIIGIWITFFAPLIFNKLKLTK